MPPFSKKFFVTKWGWSITFLYLCIWSALLAKDYVMIFPGSVKVAFLISFLEVFHLLLYGSHFITSVWLIHTGVELPPDLSWLFSSYKYLFLACLFLRAASGFYLTPSGALHRVCVFEPLYLLLQGQPSQTGRTYLWLVHTEVHWTGLTARSGICTWYQRLVAFYNQIVAFCMVFLWKYRNLWWVICDLGYDGLNRIPQSYRLCIYARSSPTCCWLECGSAGAWILLDASGSTGGL